MGRREVCDLCEAAKFFVEFLSGDEKPVLSARREALVASLCGEEKEVGNLCDAATEVCA